jgi:hypothetical protein
LSRKSDTTAAIRYARTRWAALTRFCDDGNIEIDNNAAERALRGVALGRKIFLVAGSDSGGERAAVIYSLIGSAKLNGLDPEAYLRLRSCSPGISPPAHHPQSKPQPKAQPRSLRFHRPGWIAAYRGPDHRWRNHSWV